MPAYVINTCEHCHHASALFYCRSADEYLCEPCIDQLGDEANEENAGEDDQAFNVFEGLFDDPIVEQYFN